MSTTTARSPTMLAGAGRIAMVLALACFALAQSGNVSAGSPAHRFWSDAFSAYFYTIDDGERAYVAANLPQWSYQGANWAAHAAPMAGTIPVYRFWSDSFLAHFFTTSAEERDHVGSVLSPWWRYEGIAFHAYPGPVSHSRPVYRFWSDIYQTHFFTGSMRERDLLIGNDPAWAFEGIAWYAPIPGVEPANGFEGALPLEVPDTFFESIDYPDDIDVFRLDLPAGTFRAHSTGATDTFAVLFDAAGQGVASNDDSHDLNFQLEVPVAAGTYFLAVAHTVDGTGFYGLVLSHQGAGPSAPSAPGRSRETALPIGVNSTYSSTLSRSDQNDWYRLDVPGRGILRLWTDGPVRGTEGLLTDAWGNTLQIDSGPSAHLFVSQGFSFGETVYLRVRPGTDMRYNPYLGAYTLHAEFYPQ